MLKSIVIKFCRKGNVIVKLLLLVEQDNLSSVKRDNLRVVRDGKIDRQKDLKLSSL